MSDNFAFSSTLNLVWAVVLVLSMGFVHFYMSMVATSFDPCPDEEIDANLKASIDKSTKYFNDIKMIHVGIAVAIILTMLIGRVFRLRSAQNVCSIITVVLKLAACLIVVFGVSHAQNILKIRNHQCKNKIEESKVRELKILIEICIGSIGVIIGNYLSLGINNLISFKIDTSTSIIITTIICILLVSSIIGGDALINIFKKEMNIKNECLALDEALSNANVQLGAVGGVFQNFMPNKLEALPTSKTTSVTKDYNEGFTVMGGKPVITTDGETYEPSTSTNSSKPNIKIKFTEALTIPKDHSLRVTFPKEFKFASNGIFNTAETPVKYPTAGNTITIEPNAPKNKEIAKDVEYTLEGITLPKVTGITQPIKLEIVKGADVVSVSNNNFFDIKNDNTITIDSSKKMSKIFVRTKGEHLVGENVKLRITNDDNKEDVRLPYFEGNKSINMKKDVGHSSTAGGEFKREDYNHYSIKRIPTTNTIKIKVASSITKIETQAKVDPVNATCKGGDGSVQPGWDNTKSKKDCISPYGYKPAILEVNKHIYIKTDTLDGVVLETNTDNNPFKILLTGQTDKTQNGVYKVGKVTAATNDSPGKTIITKDDSPSDGDFIEIEEGTDNKDKIFKKIGNDYKDEKENYIDSNIFEMTMDNANMPLEDDKFYYFELPLEIVDSGKALKIEEFKLEIGKIKDGVFENSKDSSQNNIVKVFKGSYTLNGSARLTTTTTEVIEQQIACPVLSRDLFMKIFLTSVMTGWAVSTIIYLTADLYEYNYSNIALMMGGGGTVTDTATTAATAAAAATTAVQNAQNG